MFSLPSIAQNFVLSASVLGDISDDSNMKYFDFYRQKKLAIAEPNFNEEQFDANYLTQRKISAEELNQTLRSFNNLFAGASQNLGSYELVNIKEGLRNYAASQNKIKRIVNYVEFNPANIEDLLTNDDADLTKTVAKAESIYKDSEKAFKDYIKKYSKDYDNLSIKDFKGDNVSDELALQRFAMHLTSLFLRSDQTKKENKDRAGKLKSIVNPFNPVEFNILKKVNEFEMNKLKLNAPAAKAMFNSNYSIDQVDNILGGDYITRKNWKNNLTNKFKKYYSALINNSQAQ